MTYVYTVVPGHCARRTEHINLLFSQAELTITHHASIKFLLRMTLPRVRFIEIYQNVGHLLGQSCHARIAWGKPSSSAEL